jgi:hypothetical protein
MGYYVRVFGTQDSRVPVAQINQRLFEKFGADVTFEIDDESETHWNEATLVFRDGPEISHIERNPVIEGELGWEELQEFREQIASCKPVSGVEWLRKYLDRVAVIYAFQLLSGTDCQRDRGWDAHDIVFELVRSATKGIGQFDLEGFTNEDGFTIIWQFSDSVEGKRACAVRGFLGKWIPFEMELGDPIQREEFWAGKVPTGARRA